MRNLLLSGILIFCLSSCDCYYHVSGIILDKQTKEPLAGVIMGAYHQSGDAKIMQLETSTAQDGTFTISKVSGSCSVKDFLLNKKGYHSTEVSLLNNSFDTIYMEPKEKKPIVLFNPKKDFQILDIKKGNDHDSSDTGNLTCDDWSLNESQIEDIIQCSEGVSGTEWHYLFGHYPCWIYGKIKQGDFEYSYNINSGSWLNIGSEDTSLVFGNFNDAHRKFFLDTPWLDQDDTDVNWRHTADFDFRYFKEYPLNDTIELDLNSDGLKEKVYWKTENKCRSLVIASKDHNNLELGCEKENHIEIPQPLDWLEMWCVVYDEQVNEVIFTENLDIVEETPLNLDQPSIYIGNSKVGGGILTFKNGQLRWVHQSG